MTLQHALTGEKVRIGIAGAGVFGGYHAQKYHDHKHAKISCVFDKDQQAASDLAQKYSCSSNMDFDAFLDQVDAVIITVPARHHAMLAIHALKHHKHVFIEKPIALDLADAEDIIRLAEERALILQIGHQERYVVDAMGLFSLPQKPHLIECKRCMPATGRGEDVSVVMDLMIHDLDIVAQFNNSISPLVTIDDNVCDIHNACADLGFKNNDGGLKAILTANRHSDKRERSLRLAFDDGEIFLDFLNRTIKNTTSFILQDPFEKTGEEPKDKNLALSDPLAYGADVFLRSMQTNTPPIVTGHDGLVALNLALQIEQAMSIAPLLSDVAPVNASTNLLKGALV